MLPRFFTGRPQDALTPGWVMASQTSVKLVLSSEVRLVDVAHAASETMAGIAGFEEDDALNVGIAVREAVINAMLHGNRLDRTRKVEVSLRGRPGSVRVKVRDHGAGFDAAATPDPTMGDNLMRSSGRGILVMRAFVDRVDFKFVAGHGMEVTLEKKRAGAKAASTTRPTTAVADNGGIE
jgi:serine/threonine-protein kinase RsbW